MGLVGRADGNEALRRVLPNATVIIHLLAMLSQGLWVVVRHHLVGYLLLGNVITADSIRGLMIPKHLGFYYKKVIWSSKVKDPIPLLKIVRVKATTTTTTSCDHINKVAQA